MVNSHKNQQCQYLHRTVGNNGSSTSFLHASDDYLDLVLWNGVPFNDERIFQLLLRVEWMMILSV